MAVTMHSSYITATDPKTAISQYTVKMGSGVNTDAAVVSAEAKTQYAAMEEAYKNLKTHFTQLGSLFTESAKYCTGTMKTKAQKCATACTNQGKYCGNRLNDLKEAFKYAQLESKIAELEAALAAIEKEDSGSASA